MVAELAFQHNSTAALMLVCGDHWSWGTAAVTNVGTPLVAVATPFTWRLQVALSPHLNSNGRVPLINVTLLAYLELLMLSIFHRYVAVSLIVHIHIHFAHGQYVAIFDILSFVN